MSRAFVGALARRAARRYPGGDPYARHFAYGKLTRDPIFAHVLSADLIGEGARVLDLGCGQGVLGAFIAAAREAHADAEWDAGWSPPPRLASLTGIDLDRRDVQRAAAALPDASFIHADIRSADFGKADVVALFDVLHYIDLAAQEAVLQRIRAALASGGTLIARVADADGSMRFRCTLAADRLATALLRRSLGRLHTRPLAHWRELLESLGFRVEERPMSEGTPFANMMLVARYDPPVAPNATPA